jgi:hypothetical protein
MTATPFRTLTLAFAAGGMTIAAPASALPTVSGSAYAEAAPVYGDMTYNHGRDRHDNGRHRGWDKRDRDDHRSYRGYQSYSRYRAPVYQARPYYQSYPANYGEPVYRNTRVWQGNDGRYYCRKSNGTTGLLVGGAVGALLGREVAGRGGDRTLGAILGAAGGALLGRSLDGGTRCG